MVDANGDDEEMQTGTMMITTSIIMILIVGHDDEHAHVCDCCRGILQSFGNYAGDCCSRDAVRGHGSPAV